MGAPHTVASGHDWVMTSARPRWSWANNRDEADGFIAEADRLVGQSLVGVRYIDIDYRSDTYRGDAAGPRVIDSVEEWREPTWAHAACHSVDFAVELLTGTGARFTVSWESPGMREGLGLREFEAVGTAVGADADVAIWDVSHQPQWRELMEKLVESVDLCYEPWGHSEALWCRRTDLRVGGRGIALLLAEGVWQSDDLVPSADNVAIVFGEHVTPPW